MAEWRCQKDSVLLAKIESQGKVSIHYKDISYEIEGSTKIEARCRKCGCINTLKPKSRNK